MKQHGLGLVVRCAIFMLWTFQAVQLLAQDQNRPPNFILVTCDNLGYGDIEPFGSQLHRTPQLSRMASEGRIFSHFYATAGVCTPSRASLLTGCYAQRVGMHDNPRDGIVLRPVSPYGLHPDEVTIAEILKEEGYATACIGKWHLGDQLPFLPSRQGFDFYFGIPYSDDMTLETGRRLGNRLDGMRWPPLPLMRDEAVIEAPVDRNLLTQRYTQQALKFIEEHRERPFFIYLPHAMPGSTKAPFSSPAFRGRSRNGAWGDAVEELDWSMGQILDQLRKFGLQERTLVVWTSDNGAPVRGEEDLSRGSNRPLHGRGYDTSEGAFRVPAIMWWPGQVPPDTECRELATMMDLMPTLAKLSGRKTDLPHAIDGHDIRPLMFGASEASSPYEYFCYYQGRQLQAIRSGRWKLFLPLDEFTRHPHFVQGEPNSPLLFDLVKDVGCNDNRAGEFPEVVEQMMKFAARAREELGDQDQAGTGQRPIDAVTDPLPRVR